MDSNFSIRFLICFLILYSITCAKELSKSVNEKETVPLSEVKEYVKGIVSDLVHQKTRDIDRLKEIIYSQGIKIAGLENEILTHQTTISKLETRLTLLEEISETYLESKKESLDGLEKDETPNQMNVKTRERLVKPEIFHRARRAPDESGCAFSAYMTANAEHLGQQQDIVFDHVITNVGNAYNSHHGTFVAPVTGTYVFYFSLHSPGARADLVKNGQAIAYLYIGNDQASQLAIVNLNAGDDVSVHNLQADKMYWGSGYSTFSGFLLYEGMESTQILG